MFTYSIDKCKKNLQNGCVTQEEFEKQVNQWSKYFQFVCYVLPVITFGVMAIGINSYSSIFFVGLVVVYICRLISNHLKWKYEVSLQNREITSKEYENKINQFDKYHTFVYVVRWAD
ncbi:MAG: hypothetical protein PV340_02005 [Wolbachia sp.]|nr:hypothetical protein [Wolbachia sp.]MDD9336480.1 hypothetical protein [Wolbachia sp.]